MVKMRCKFELYNVKSGVGSKKRYEDSELYICYSFSRHLDLYYHPLSKVYQLLP